MPHKSRKKCSTGIYHIYFRGINKEKIFHQKREKERLKKIIRKYLEEYEEVEIYAYCIMSTHAHLIVKSELEELSMFMSKILAEYAKYYNYKHNRNGHVFQNRFGSECIEKSGYLWNCLRYVHMNPVKAHMVSSVLDYKYSSIKEYQSGKRDILHKNAIQLYRERFDSWTAFLEFHLSTSSFVFLDTPEEIYRQRKESALFLLWQFQQEKQLEHGVEVLEEAELRKEYLEKLRTDLNISVCMRDKIYKELKKELIE